MENNNNINIEDIKPDEYKEAAILLSKAFIGTPFSAYVAGGADEKARRNLETGFMGMIKNKPGRVVVAKDGKQIVGVMRMVQWPQCQNSIPRGLELLFPMIFARKVILRVLKFRSIWRKHDPQKPHWHIDPLGVLPERQGQGIGSLLLTYFCEHVDKLGMPAYHETDVEANVRLYKRFGYEVIDEERIFSFNHWFMWRAYKDIK
ncbi:MAG: GNAT family N-acetyltransferase [Dehalococcoidales bacterium]|nr:MAG: GNAT family N-acetyltransferase [Dehalococcoidales bacterium]